MALPQFESCCFCIPLRTGTLVLGYLHLIGSLLGIILSSLMIVGGAVVTSGNVDLGAKEYHFNENDKNALANEQVVKMAGVLALAVGIILLILFIVHIVFVIFLLIGGHNSKPGHIKAYLIYSTVMVIIAVLLTIVSLIAAPSAAVVSHFISYAIEIYFLLVIRSYMIKLQENPEGDRAGKVYKS